MTIHNEDDHIHQLTQLESLNRMIGNLPDDQRQLISDGYHTFKELYDHRIALWIALCKEMERFSGNGEIGAGDNVSWRSKLHSDGTAIDGWFILGIETEPTKQITYHLPMDQWDRTNFAETLERAPEWDGHTAHDVVERLGQL